MALITIPLERAQEIGRLAEQHAGSYFDSFEVEPVRDGESEIWRVFVWLSAGRGQRRELRLYGHSLRLPDGDLEHWLSHELLSLLGIRI